MNARGNNRNYEEYDAAVEWSRAAEADAVKISLPGYKREEIRVLVDNHGHLRTRGERPVSGNRWSRFQKDFQIPADCNVDGIRAKFDNDTLTITLPKKSTSPQAAPVSPPVPAPAPPSRPEPTRPATAPPQRQPMALPEPPKPSPPPRAPAPPPVPATLPTVPSQKPVPERRPSPPPRAPAPPPVPATLPPVPSQKPVPERRPSPPPRAPAPPPVPATLPPVPSQKPVPERWPSLPRGPADVPKPKEEGVKETKKPQAVVEEEEKRMEREARGRMEEDRKMMEEKEEGVVMETARQRRPISASRGLLVNVAVAVVVLVGITVYVWHTLRNTTAGHGEPGAGNYSDEM